MINLLQQLFKKTARQSREFDRYQVDLLKRLRTSPSEKVTIQLIEECLEYLPQEKIPLEDTLSEGRLLVSQSQLQLQKLSGLSERTQNKIQDAKSILPPYSIIEFHNELTNIIKIYQRIVIELSKNKGIASNQQQSSLCKDISTELQQLILNLDIAETYITQLEDIQQEIANSTDPLQLPQYCNRIISIIIDSSREERRSSRHFLYSLNDSLTQFYLNFASSIKYAENAFEEQKQCIKTIQKKSLKLKNTAETAMDIESLRTDIFSYVGNVEQIFKAKEKENDQKVQQKLQALVREIKELQSETQNYQKTIKQQKKQLHIDFLTKIPNRAAWSERLQLEYNRYKRYKNQLHIAVIDIDKFKKINDTFGHLAGDKVLSVIAQTLQKSLRNVDFLARYGGEEFAILLPEINQQQRHIALEKLREKIKKIPFKFKKDKISITISIGCTNFFPEDNIDSAFERADQALYHAKNNGRDQVAYFENN
ncbi:MAG: GGDEF domain-containing protein [Psychromonas sp.]|nr:GGDEF domain-containing protein [Psychromonas sp.]